MKAQEKEALKSARADGLVVLTSSALFLCSLAFPAVYIESNPEKFYYGLHCYALGSFLGADTMIIPWFANHTFWLSIVLLLAKRRKASFFVAICSLAMGATFFAFSKIPINEAIHYREITSLGVGFYLWLTSLILPSLAYIIHLTTGSSSASDHVRQSKKENEGIVS